MAQIDAVPQLIGLPKEIRATVPVKRKETLLLATSATQMIK